MPRRARRFFTPKERAAAAGLAVVFAVLTVLSIMGVIG